MVQIRQLWGDIEHSGSSNGGTEQTPNSKFQTSQPEPPNRETGFGPDARNRQVVGLTRAGGMEDATLSAENRGVVQRFASQVDI